MTKTLAASLLALAAAITSPAHARPMTEMDLATLKRLAAPSVAPDGRAVVYQLTTTDFDSNTRSTSLYWLDLSTPNAQAMPFADMPDKNETAPQFAPNSSRVYFLAPGDGKQQLWYIDKGAASPVQASRFATDVAGFKIAPDGKRIAVWGDIAKSCPSFGCESDGNTALPGPGTGREYSEMFVRHWDAWETPGNYSRVFAFDLDDGKVSGAGMAMDGDLIGDSPSKPFGGAEEIAWAPDSSGVLFTLRKADRNEPLSTNLDIYGKGFGEEPPTNFTQTNLATDTMPTPSPDGRYLAYAAMSRAGYEADRQVLMIRDMADGSARALTEGWDRSVGSIAWAPDSQSLYVTAGEILDTPVFQVDLSDGKTVRLSQTGHIANVVPLADGALLYAKDSLHTPAELFRLNPDRSETQLTFVNKAVLDEVDPVTVERFSFKGAAGATVWGQIIKPTGSAAADTVNGKLPIAFLIHGGPQGSFGDAWSFRWNPKVMASQGYAAVTVDFHGSTGYGQAFTDSINKDWGGKPLVDLQLGLAAAGAKDAGIDTGNACALGASYGGYMVNWIAGVWPDAFKCIVQHDGVFDLRAMAFETEELWFDEWDHGGPWWSRDKPEQWNPVNHVAKWQTPMLVITGEQDFRIPYTQGLAAFTALQRRGVPSKLLVFPDENHWVLKAKNSVQWHRNVFAWLKQWTKGGE